MGTIPVSPSNTSTPDGTGYLARDTESLRNVALATTGRGDQVTESIAHQPTPFQDAMTRGCAVRTERPHLPVAAAALVAAVAALAGCGPQEADVTPDQARDTLTSVIHESAELLDTDGWENDGAPGILDCDNGNGVKWSYGYNAMPGDVEPLADAEKIVAHWESLGVTVRINTDHDPVVFATGGPLQGLSFSTGPGLYGIGGTSACVPGNANQIREQEYRG